MSHAWRSSRFVSPASRGKKPGGFHLIRDVELLTKEWVIVTLTHSGRCIQGIINAKVQKSIQTDKHDQRREK